MKPRLYRDYRNAMYIKSCIDFCDYMAKKAEQKEEVSELEHWTLKRNLFQTDMALGLLTATRDWEIEQVITNDNSWNQYIERGPVKMQRWELESDY